ncbi:Aspirochlorine biosynthesis protein N-like protein 2 [Elsinoe fawcettii]|nr:Aspirochlorine biosynthesis protein N-like protein 2 [Elsinoe fawcettii]
MSRTTTLTSTIVTSVLCLQRLSRYNTEKPYELRCDYPPDFPRTNLQWDKPRKVSVRDIRSCSTGFDMKKDGFSVMNISTSMEPKDFDDKKKVKTEYAPLVATALQKHLGANFVQVHDWLVRKSEVNFPVSTGQRHEYEQPATVLHIDSTPEDTKKLALELGHSEEYLQRMRYQYVTVWRPLSGPVRRWPMLVCDMSTVDKQEDLIPRDMIYKAEELETFLVHWSEKFRFYYISDQTPNEALVMLQSDSRGLTGAPHSSFEHPGTKADDPQRESIEMRMLVFYDEDE